MVTVCVTSIMGLGPTADFGHRIMRFAAHEADAQKPDHANGGGFKLVLEGG